MEQKKKRANTELDKIIENGLGELNIRIEPDQKVYITPEHWKRNPSDLDVQEAVDELADTGFGSLVIERGDGCWTLLKKIKKIRLI